MSRKDEADQEVLAIVSTDSSNPEAFTFGSLLSQTSEHQICAEEHHFLGGDYEREKYFPVSVLTVAANMRVYY